MYEAIWNLEFKEQRYSRDFLYAAVRGLDAFLKNFYIRRSVSCMQFCGFCPTAIPAFVDYASL
jgi:hypothetical protein